MRILLFLLPLVAACEFLGLCPSDPCSVDADCLEDHVCAVGQCVKPCDSLTDCPVETSRCYDPQGRLGFSVCADADGVPGQMCDPTTDSRE